MTILTPSLTCIAQRPGYIYDYAHILTEIEIEALEDLCTQIDMNTTNEIIIVILENLDNYQGNIESAKLEYYNEKPLDNIVGIGKEGKDNGVLILIAFKEREWAFETGYGAEGYLTDSESGRIGREVITPYFQEDEYYTGLFITIATIGEEMGYDLEAFDPVKNEPPDPSLFDILLEDPLTLVWWLLGSGGDYALIILVLLVIAIIARSLLTGGLGGGGRSGGGGSKGRW
ncbi:hypothetical protein GF326_02235 [Candidatus Bathyarchaeota archaeon]|nr:hypothetical protein [Candidatus Bathyarchaeota archaeon]